MSIDGALRGAGMPVPEQTQFCVDCRELGHACAAQRGVDLCVFCEDGEPCPVTAAAARTATQAEKNKPAAPQTKKPAPDAQGFSEWQKTRTAYRDKRKAAKAAKTNGYAEWLAAGSKQKEKTMEQQKLCKCGCGQEVHSPLRDYARGHNPENRATRIACPECKKELARNSLYIHMPAKHQWTGEQVSEYLKKRTSNGSVQKPTPKPVTQKVAKSNGHATPPEKSEGVATIVVTEGALNTWWAKQPIQSKADLFTLAMTMTASEELAASSK